MNLAYVVMRQHDGEIIATFDTRADALYWASEQVSLVTVYCLGSEIWKSE